MWDFSLRNENLSWNHHACIQTIQRSKQPARRVGADLAGISPGAPGVSPRPPRALPTGRLLDTLSGANQLTKGAPENMSAKRTAIATAAIEEEQHNVVAEVEKPAEEAAALALRERFVTFHAGASGRSTLTADDRAVLEEMTLLAKAYSGAAHAAWRSTEEWVSADSMPQSVSLIPSIIDEYVNTTTATVTLPLTSGRNIEAPSIESATVRGVLVRQGEGVIAAMDGAIACGYTRIAKVADSKARAETRLRYWLGVPVVRSLCVALVAVVDASADMEESFYNVGGLLETLKQIQMRYKGQHHDAPEPLYVHIGTWRRWLPTAREILKSEQREAA